jgi:hypothetical protein
MSPITRIDRDRILTTLEDIENPYEEDACIVGLKDERNIVVRGKEFITESGYAYHVSVTVPDTKKWRERLEASWGISFKGSTPDVKVIDGRLEFGIPVPISQVANDVRGELEARGIDVGSIPERIWTEITGTTEYIDAEKEIARQTAANQIIEGLHLKDVC